MKVLGIGAFWVLQSQRRRVWRLSVLRELGGRPKPMGFRGVGFRVKGLVKGLTYKVGRLTNGILLWSL